MAIFNRIILFTAAFGCFVSIITGGFLFKKYSPEINYYSEFFKNPKEFSAQNILNKDEYSPQNTELTEGQILFFLNVTEEMNEASRNVFLKSGGMRLENHFEDNRFLKKNREDARAEAFAILRARLNTAYISLDEYRFIRNRVLAGLDIPKLKAFKNVSAFKNTIALDIFTLPESQISFKRIVESTKKIELLESEKNLVKDFKSRIFPNLLPVLAGMDAMSVAEGNQENDSKLALRN
ncbi:MAG: hypothetical protein V4642_15365 [Bacteroidota bacterium]